MNNHKITFNKENHTYTVGGKEAVSVTTILKATGISKDFSEVDEFVKKKVEAAAERGNYYDDLAGSAIENPFDLTEWQERFLNFMAEKGIDLKRSQVMYGSTKPFPIAGTCDFEGREIETNNMAILDLKATYEIYLNSVTWQVNIYAWLKDEENYEHFDKYVIHYSEKDNRFTLVKLQTIPKGKIIKLLECFQLDELYTEDNSVANVIDFKLFSKTFSKVKEYEEMLKKEKGKLDDFYTDIKKHMSENHIKTFDLEEYKITYTGTGTRRLVDFSKAAEEKNLEKLKVINEFLEENGKEKYELIKVEDLKEQMSDKEKEKYTKVTSVSDKLTVTEKKSKK